MKLSVVMIVKNEELLLAKCLESVKDADEIIICDTGSKDKTVEVAKRYTDKVYTDYVWNDDFSEARNHAQSKATGDWILIIDADEVLLDGSMDVIRKEIENITYQKTLMLNVAAQNNPDKSFRSPRVYKNVPDVYWKAPIHNYLTHNDGPQVNATIIYGYSPAHADDPYRSLRILQKTVDTNPKAVREVFYLGREYHYKKEWDKCIHYLTLYVKERAVWGPEWAEAWLLLAKTYKRTNRWEDARDAVLQALKLNTNFKEALIFMAELSGPINKKRWLYFADSASNDDVLFKRTPVEQNANYYDQLFTTSDDMSRYTAIHKQIGEWAKGKKLDMGCGTGELQHYVNNYHGFDFSEVGVKTAQHPNVWKGDLYTENLEGYDTYIVTEVLEHVDDKAVLKRIPSGSYVILSVPNFEDKSHIRIYTEEIMRNRFDEFIDIKSIVQFNWVDNSWQQGGPEGKYYILLVDGIRK